MASSFLSFDLSVSPEQAAPGDEVTFTISITNRATTTVTGLVFSDDLPEVFGNGKNGFGNFNFDQKTRRLSWNGDKKTRNSLAAGETLTLQYSLKVDSKLDTVQIKDVASLTADGWSDPILAQAIFIVAPLEKHLSVVGPKGGKAQGLDGKIKIDLPKGILKKLEAISIEDKNQDYPASNGENGRFFSVTRYTAPDMDLLAPITSTDQIAELKPVETVFDEPVELTVSFDGLKDLKKIPASQSPYLVTLNDVSGTWIRIPLDKVDTENNTVSATIPHFSTWGVGVGAAFPKNDAQIPLFDLRRRISLAEELNIHYRYGHHLGATGWPLHWR